MRRKTKIMGTIGPASSSPEILGQLIRNGLDIIRLNFSHIGKEQYEQTADLIRFIRDTADVYGRNVAIFQDLGGIKLRIGVIATEDGIVHLAPGSAAVLRNTESSNDPEVIPFPHEDILCDLAVGNRVYLADGTIRLDVMGRAAEDVLVNVHHGGDLSSHKGANLPGVTINRPVITEKDMRDAEFGAEQNVDWIGASFVQTAQDILDMKVFLTRIGSEAMVMAKIEKQRALDNIDAIIEVADGIMVARGDLGIEIPMEQVPGWQKVMLRKAQAAGKPSITATQVFSSMVHAERPTRAECSDAFNAVEDGSSGILLSDEVAIGRHPLEVLQVAHDTILEAEKMYEYYPLLTPRGATEITVYTACQQAQMYDRSKIIVVTSTGRAAIATAKFQPEADIIAVTHDVDTMRKLAMVWGIYPGGVVPATQAMTELVRSTLDTILETGAVNPDEQPELIMIYGYMPGVTGTTNTVQRIPLSDYLVRKRSLEQEYTAAA